MSLLRRAHAEPISGYRLIEPLGSGGFGEVWKCEAPGGLFKALKFVNGKLDSMDDADGVWAEQELNALQRVKEIRHPFILSIERVEIIDGELVIVMELADRNLYDRFRECQAMGQAGIPRPELLSYLRDAAEALDLMNCKPNDLQHLDIKPRNLFLVSNHVKVADFGLVKDLESVAAGGSGVLGGITPLYAAPETFQGIISRHSDQYSLAIVYQELLTGSPPFDGNNARSLAIQHVKQDPDLSSLPEGDRPALGRALSKDPRQRFATCMSLVRALETGTLPEAEDVPTARSRFLVPKGLDDLLGEKDEKDKSGTTVVSPRLTPQEIERLSVSVAQPMRGSLQPTLVIGVGSFGLRAIQALRFRVMDRFESLARLPLLRFMYIDTNSRSIKDSQNGPSEQALDSTETCHLPLQAIGHYRRNHQTLEQVTDWLPIEKLYSIPRSLETKNSRALARLAWADNYRRSASRIRRALQVIMEPNILDHSVNQTGLALRSETPQVYILAAAGGGTGSGILLDLAFGLRQILNDIKRPESEILSVLFCGAPDDPAIPAEEQANLYATLTEVNHFSDSTVAWAAQYGVDGPSLRQDESPFSAVYLVQSGHRSPEGVQLAASNIAGYVFHDMSTPLGLKLSQSRELQRLSGETPFRSFGTYTVWYPRGLLLRLAAHQVCFELVQRWTRMSEDSEGQGALDRIDLAMSGPDWEVETLRSRIEEAASNASDGSPHEALTAVLSTLDAQAEQSIARQDAAGWCRQAIERVIECVGGDETMPDDVTDWHQSRAYRAFHIGVKLVAEAYAEVLSGPALASMDEAGLRFAGADSLLTLFGARCEQQFQSLDKSIKEIGQRVNAARQAMESAVHTCLTSGQSAFSFFGGSRIGKHLKSFCENLSVFARLRLENESLRSVQLFYAELQGLLGEMERDIAFCRQRLRHLEDSFVTSGDSSWSYQDADGGDPHDSLPELPMSSSRLLQEAASGRNSRIVLPEGAEDLETAAARLYDLLKDEHWQELDAWLQAELLAPMGGLYVATTSAGDLVKELREPLLRGVSEYLSRHLPETNVCEAELSAAEKLNIDLAAQAKAYYKLAEPNLRSEKEDNDRGYLLVSNNEAGHEIAAETKRSLPDIIVVHATAHGDLMFCREQANMGLSDLQSLLEKCKPAYVHFSSGPATTPHSRCDILDWVPIEA